MAQCLSFIAVMGIGLLAASPVARAQQSQVDAVSSSVAKLEEEVAAYREALKELTRERAPRQWATTQDSLGRALARLGERESGTGKLDEAIAGLSRGVEGTYTRARSAPIGDDAEQSRPCARGSRGARERDRQVRGGGISLSRGAEGMDGGSRAQSTPDRAGKSRSGERVAGAAA